MKTIMNIRNIFVTGLAISMLSAVSCEEIIKMEPELEDVQAIFPTEEAIILQHAQEKEITFKADADWQLNSSSAWCKFLDDGAEVSVLYGKAGEQVIKVKANAEGIEIGDPDQISLLELIEGKKTSVLAQIVLSAPKAELFLKDETGEFLLDENKNKINLRNQVYELSDSYSNQTEIYFHGNYREFEFLNVPSYISITGPSKVTKKVKNPDTGKYVFEEIENLTKIKIRISASYIKEYKEMEGDLILSHKSGAFFMPIHWKYNAKPIKAKIEGPSPMDEWSVNLAGTEFIQKGRVGMPGQPVVDAKFYNYLPFTQEASVDYDVIYIEKIGEDFKCSLEDKIDWMNFNKENLTFKVKSSEIEREGWVFAVVKNVSSTLTGENWRSYFLKEGSDGATTIVTGLNYNNNIVLHLFQKDPEIIDPNMYFRVYSADEKKMDCTKETDREILQVLFNTAYQIANENVYQVKQTGRNFIIKTLPGTNFSNMKIFDAHTGQEVKNVADKFKGGADITLNFLRDLNPGEAIALIGLDNADVMSPKAYALVFKSNK